MQDEDTVEELEFSDEEDYEPEFDCGMDADGNCGHAGSEECEFECPHNRP